VPSLTDATAPRGAAPTVPSADAVVALSMPPASGLSADKPARNRPVPAQHDSTAHTRRPRSAHENRERGQGQWALGYKEPLNPNERMKKDDNGLNVRARIENLYRYTGFDSIDPSDLRGRFRWWGLYTQRAPGIDGGRTAVLEPEELEDKYFMMRVRIDGGPSVTYPPGTPATPPTSPIGRTSSCTGSASRTSPTSGSGWRASGFRRPKPAVMCHA
jgi:sulfite reductase (ferredoxin)